MELIMRKVTLAALAILLGSTFTAFSVRAKGHEEADHEEVAGENQATADTITWWCTNLNELWDVEVPVITGLGSLEPPVPSPIPDPCSSPFPVVVPSWSRFVPGGTYVWYLNKSYPKAIRAALAAQGYDFRSQSPVEDFLSKVVQVRVEVRTLDWNTLVAEYTFDPRHNFRIVNVGEFDGKRSQSPVVNPALGIDIPADAVARLPLVGFPVVAGPLPKGTAPGVYWAAVYWTLSSAHNDGLGLENINFLPAGEFYYGANRFMAGP
jgi:hypothetical protein